MALHTEIKQPDGVVTKYHRVLSVTQIVNEYTAIAVVSYVDEKSRKNDLIHNGENRPYRQAVTRQIDYDESMTIEKAYTYLKTLPEFEGAQDV